MKGLILFFVTANCFAANGVHSFQSKFNYEATKEKIEDFMSKKKLTLFKIVDHSQNAKNAGLNLSKNQVYIFGNPKVGTPLMKKNPLVGLDLPVKILIHQNGSDKVTVSYNTPSSLSRKYNINEDHPSFKKMNQVFSIIEKTLK